MTQTQLSAFRAVAEAGGFSRGAERLMISQPALSLQVGELEAALGAKLFDRLPRGVRLTGEGALLLDYARRLHALESEAQQAVRDLQGLSRGRLVIGASLTIGSYVLPMVLGEFGRKFPGIELELEIANTQQIQRKLIDNTLDLGFTEGLADDPRLVSQVFHSDVLMPIARPDHPLVKRSQVTAKMFFREPMIWREKGSGTRLILEKALAKHRIVVTPVMSLGSIEAIKKCVEAGIGLAVVSELAIVSEIKIGSLAIVPVVDLRIRRPLHLLRLKGKSDSAAAAELVKVLKGQFAVNPKRM